MRMQAYPSSDLFISLIVVLQDLVFVPCYWIFQLFCDSQFYRIQRYLS